MRAIRNVVRKIVLSVATVVSFSVYLYLGVKHRKKISNGWVRYFSHCLGDVLRHPLDGFHLWSDRKKGKKKRRLRKFFFRINPWRLVRRIRRKIGALFSISGIDWEDN